MGKKKSNSKSEGGGGGSDNQDDKLLINDVASFASSLGLSSASTTDYVFRKQSTNNHSNSPNIKNKKRDDNYTNKQHQPKPRAQPPLAPIDNSHHTFDKFKNLPKVPLVKASSLGVWYVDAAELEQKLLGNGDKVEYKNVDEWKLLVSKKKDLGERLMAQYAQDFETSRGKSGDIKMLTATQRSGTAADKVSAFSVMVAENPLANIKSLDALIGMVTSKVGKRHALTGFEALKEMFISSLLPERKLKSLFQRPVNHLPESKDGYSLLLFWYWEECLKQRYERFVFALEEASRDVLAVLKDKALKTMYTLLSSKSEQERRLLAALVNKLGDPENKAASNADYHLSKLLSDHPNMKVRNEKAEDFLKLLKEWERLCALFSLIGDESHQKQISPLEMKDSIEDDEEEEEDNEEIFEVEKILSICYGVPDGVFVKYLSKWLKNFSINIE